jgi:hypothetical protein
MQADPYLHIYGEQWGFVHKEVLQGTRAIKKESRLQQAIDRPSWTGGVAAASRK